MSNVTFSVWPIHYTYGGVDYTAEVRDGTGWVSMMRFIESEALAYDWAERTAQERRITLAAQAKRARPLPMDGADYRAEVRTRI